MSIRLLKYTHEDDDGMLLNYTFLSRIKYVAIFFLQATTLCTIEKRAEILWKESITMTSTQAKGKKH